MTAPALARLEAAPRPARNVVESLCYTAYLPPYTQAAAPSVTLYRVSEKNAKAWAHGVLTDFALRLADTPDGPALFIAEFQHRRGWREVLRECRRLRPVAVIYRARSPVIVRHGQRWNLRPWHRDEWADRYHVSGPTLDQILNSFPQ